MLVDCGIVEVGDRAVRSNLPAQSQIATSILPPPLKKASKIPFKKRSRHAIPRPFQPKPRLLRLIVMSSAVATRRIVRFRPPGQKMKAIPPPPLQRILSIFPLERRADTPSLGRPSPHPNTHWFIVMFLRLETRRMNQICPPGCNLMKP